MNGSSMKFDKFRQLYYSLHMKSITEKRLEGEILTNYWPFVKFIKIFPNQTFVLYVMLKYLRSYSIMYVCTCISSYTYIHMYNVTF